MNIKSTWLAKGIAVLGIAGLLGGVVATTPAQADPPRKIFGVKTDRNRHDDHRGHDKKWDNDHRSDRARAERERLERERRSSSYRSDRDHDGTPDRYDRYPNDRRRH